LLTSSGPQQGLPNRRSRRLIHEHTYAVNGMSLKDFAPIHDLHHVVDAAGASEQFASWEMVDFAFIALLNLRYLVL
jgi:hypothetical protein